jgi:hypothetical protein
MQCKIDEYIVSDHLHVNLKIIFQHSRKIIKFKKLGGRTSLAILNMGLGGREAFISGDRFSPFFEMPYFESILASFFF